MGVDLKAMLPSAADFAGSDYWEVRLETVTHNTIRVKNGDVEVVNGRMNSRGSARALVKGGWGFASFDRLEDGARHARAAVEYARAVGGGEAAVPALPPLEVDIVGEYREHPQEVPLARKVDFALGYDGAIRSHPGVKVSMIWYQDALRRRVFYNSEGRLIYEEGVFTGGVLVATAFAAGVPETHAVSDGRRAGFETFVNLEKQVPKLLRELDEQLAAQDARGGRYDCVVNPLMAGVFAHEAFGHTSEADHFYRDPKRREVMRLGRRLGSSAVTIKDDPGVDPSLAGSIRYDDEGVEAVGTVLLERGELTSHLHSRTTAAAMGAVPNGRARAISAAAVPLVRMTNTFIAPGEASVEELLRELRNGVFVIDSRGGTGGEDFTFNARMGYLVENGKMTRPIKNFTLTGNLFETLGNVAACSREWEMFSSGGGGCGKGGQFPLPVGMGGPYVLIKNALIGGK